MASESAVDANEPWDEFDIFYNLTCEELGAKSSLASMAIDT